MRAGWIVMGVLSSELVMFAAQHAEVVRGMRRSSCLCDDWWRCKSWRPFCTDSCSCLALGIPNSSVSGSSVVIAVIRVRRSSTMAGAYRVVRRGGCIGRCSRLISETGGAWHHSIMGRLRESTDWKFGCVDVYFLASNYERIFVVLILTTSLLRLVPSRPCRQRMSDQSCVLVGHV